MIARPTQISGSPGTIVGDDTRTSVRPGCSESRHPYAATTLARTLGRAPALARQNGATKGKSGDVLCQPQAKILFGEGGGGKGEQPETEVAGWRRYSMLRWRAANGNCWVV